jgi:HAD superfamily hydrolase (TIGR01509 family)
MRAIFFDIGGVLIRTEDWSHRRRWARRFGIDERTLEDRIHNSDIGKRASIGQATRDDAWRSAQHDFGLTDTQLNLLRADFYKGDVWNLPLLKQARKLSKRFMLGIISNAWSEAREIHAEHIHHKLFDTIVYSYEERIAKPNPEIFCRALKRIGVNAKDAIFIDDVIGNVEAARHLGMKAIHFQGSLMKTSEF